MISLLPNVSLGCSCLGSKGYLKEFLGIGFSLAKCFRILGSEVL